MKTILICFLLIGLAGRSAGQVTGRITTTAGQPLSFANVLLQKTADTSWVKAGLTDEKGAYKIDYPGEGIYQLQVASVGFQSWQSPVFELTGTQQSKDFAPVALQEDHRQLADVTVSTRKPMYQQAQGGMVVNVENSPLTKGSSALQVLERSPGVTIDHRDYSISLNGKSGVMVMLNGKLVPMQIDQVVHLLEGMSADDIEKIELLSTPPASYDAAGNAGLINIVLKKNKRRGTSGSLSATGGYGWGEKASGSIQLSHNTKKLSLFGSYNYSHNRTYSELYITSAQHMPFLGGDVSTLFLDTTKSVQNNHDASVGLELKLTPKLTLGAGTGYTATRAAGTTINNADYTILPDSLLQFRGNNTGVNTWHNTANSIYLEKRMNEGEKLNASADYLHFDNNNAYQVQSSFLNRKGEQAGGGSNLLSPRQRGFADTKISVGVFKLDYTRQLSKKIKLETGGKINFTQSSSSSGLESLVSNVWSGSDETSNNIVMKESIGAAYAAVTVQPDPLVNLVLGLRYENSSTRMDNFKSGENIVRRKLGSLFPNLSITRKTGDEGELQFSYTKRIGRPTYNDLASYVGYSDPTAVYTGNPFLKPTITHNLKLGYAYKNYVFSLLYSRDVNAIVRYQLTESLSKDILFISPQNLDWQDNVGLQASMPFELNKWWTANLNINASYRHLKASYGTQPFEKKWVDYSVNFSQAFKLPKKFSAELSGFYNSTFYEASKKIDGFFVLNAGIKKELNNNKGSFQLSVTDLLSSQHINLHYGTVTREAFDIRSNVGVILESVKFPIIKLTYSRSFGGAPAKSRRSEAAGASDEKERVRKD